MKLKTLTFHLSISSINQNVIELSVHSELDNEALAEVMMTAFKELKTKDPMALRVIFFASMESLRAESELIQEIWQNLR
ncbi:MAG: hypothetical protein AAFQ94_15675 [Bacteroidota bacterium]